MPEDYVESEAVSAPREAYQVREVAALLGLPQSTVYEHIYRGKLPAIKIGRYRLVTRRQLAAYIARKEEEAEAKAG